MKAVIPVAGLGTRMLPATKAIPKEMLPIVDKPLIQYVVDEAAAAGVKDRLMVVLVNTDVKIFATPDVEIEVVRVLAVVIVASGVDGFVVVLRHYAGSPE